MIRDNSLLVAQHISKQITDGGKRWHIVDDVSLAVEPGEQVALLGPSGSGKSTLLHILGALDSAYSGNVLLDGQLVSTMGDAELAGVRAKQLGFIFQAYNLLGHLSVLENVMLPACFGGVGRNPERAHQLLEQVGLAANHRRKPGTLSGGERQRVAIARALYQHPKLVLCDEPTGNLDVDTARGIIGLFERLRNDGVALLVATHDEAVARAADRRLKIQHGKLESDPT